MVKNQTARLLLNLILITSLVFPITIFAANQDQPLVEAGAELSIESQYYADTAKEGNVSQAPSSNKSNDLVSVIVKLDFEPLATYRGGIDGLSATTPDLTGTNELDAKSDASQAYLAYVDSQINAFASSMASAIPDARLIHRYRSVIGGVSVILPDSQLDRLNSLPGVVRILLDEVNQLDTEVSPDFIGAPTVWNLLGGQETAGEGVVVGVLDSGIWPEHPSFSDPDPL